MNYAGKYHIKEQFMKTDIYRFEKTVRDIDVINELAEKAAAYSVLDEKQKLKLMLLCEELVEMLPNLLKYGNGEFWIETEGKSFAIHSVVEADDLLSSLEREDILKVSKSGKNAAAVGIMNKIKIAAEVMLANYALSKGVSGDVVYDAPPLDFVEMGACQDPVGYSDSWSLLSYKKKAKAEAEAWDELERSVIANLADDVTVGIIGGKVEVTIKKDF